MSGVLYALRTAHGEALYIGASLNPARPSQHGDKPWWSDVAWIEIEHFDTREEAHAAEQEILELVPGRFNVRRGEQIVSEDELARRREERHQRRAEIDADVERQRNSRYRVPGLRCHNCRWSAGYVTKGKAIRDCRACPTCGCDSLRVDGVPVAEYEAVAS